jgi:hypothetical protein
MLLLDQETHRYTLDGNLVPGVNEILACVGRRKYNPDLVPDGVDPYTKWQSISGMEFFEDKNAAEFGTILHDTIAMKLRGEAVEFDPQLSPWLKAWRRWRRSHNYWETVLFRNKPMIECSLYSRLYGYAGTLDWVAVHNGSMAVVDWKAWENVVPEGEVVKAVAYAQLLRENMGSGVWPQVIIVRLQKDGKPDEQAVSSSEVKRLFNRFLSVLNVYRISA